MRMPCSIAATASDRVRLCARAKLASSSRVGIDVERIAAFSMTFHESVLGSLIVAYNPHRDNCQRGERIYVLDASSGRKATCRCLWFCYNSPLPSLARRADGKADLYYRRRSRPTNCPVDGAERRGI